MFKIRKKLFSLIIYILACCTVVSSCGLINREETEQNSETNNKKKSKKKSKKKKQNVKKGSEKYEENKKTTDRKLNYSEKSRERLKLELVTALDDFFASDFTDIAIKNEKMHEEFFIVESKLYDGENTLYFVATKESENDCAKCFLTDGNITYKTNEDDTDWELDNYAVDYTSEPIVGACYVAYISFIYAALDKGLDYEYYPEDDSYYIVTDRYTVSDIDFRSIRSEIKNTDKFDLYDSVMLVNKEDIISFYPNNDVFKKEFVFYINDDAFVIFEILYDTYFNEIESSSMVRLKEEERDMDAKNNLLELFYDLKGNGRERDRNRDITPEFQLLKHVVSF